MKISLTAEMFCLRFILNYCRYSLKKIKDWNFNPSQYELTLKVEPFANYIWTSDLNLRDKNLQNVQYVKYCNTNTYRQINKKQIYK